MAPKVECVEGRSWFQSEKGQWLQKLVSEP